MSVYNLSANMSFKRFNFYIFVVLNELNKNKIIRGNEIVRERPSNTRKTLEYDFDD